MINNGGRAIIDLSVVADQSEISNEFRPARVLPLRGFLLPKAKYYFYEISRVVRLTLMVLNAIGSLITSK